MTMKVTHVLFLALPIVSALAACQNNAAKNDAVRVNSEALAAFDPDSANLVREYKLFEKLAGRKIACLDTIIPPLKADAVNIVLILSRFDCVSCVEAGYGVLRRIEQGGGTVDTYAVGLTREVIIPEDYRDTVWEDEKGDIPAALNYAPTPILLVLEGNRIVDLHTPIDAGSAPSLEFISKYLID